MAFPAPKFLAVSDGTGAAALANIIAPGRAVGSTTIPVNTVSKWPSTFFIVTTGTLLGTGYLDPNSITEMRAHVLAGSIVIDGFEPGYTDLGNTAGQVAVIKQTTGWAASVAAIGGNFNDDGSMKTASVQAALNLSTTTPDWTPLGVVPTVTASNGQRENVLTFAGQNFTDRLQPGTKIQIPRTGTTPTQSMAFASGSSQYATKTSPTGITFTTAFSAEANIYLNSYTNSAGILTRWDGTNGWLLYLDGNGKLNLQMGSGGGSGMALYTSYQSIPLKQWVHVAGTMNVSAGTGALYINGVSLPLIKTGSGTTMAQAGTLQIGSWQNLNFINGYISEARLWANVQTQSQILNNMGISLVGTETNLIGLWQGNGNFNDKTANANNLTATNGAIATQAANPYSAIEYAVVTLPPVYAASNTTVTVFTGPNIIPNATLGTTAFSSARAPYGFPVDASLWAVKTVWTAGSTQTFGIGSIGNWFTSQFMLAIPSGAWEAEFQGEVIQTSSVGATRRLGVSITPQSVGGDWNGTMSAYVESYSNPTYFASFFTLRGRTSLTSITNHYLYANVISASGSENVQVGAHSQITLVANCKYI